MVKARNKNIVIADDNQDLCMAITDVLQEVGHMVHAVNNGYELLSYLENNNPSIVILDLMMPEKDGISIISTIRHLVPHSRIIIYTGHQEYEHSVYARTADHFLVKGGNIDNLIDIVGKL
ncbi:MAG: response regulator [Candidatus Omnitrophica bacterium]|nr:response regulator [Candidatus Omnitrophota bacterium]